MPGRDAIHLHHLHASLRDVGKDAVPDDSHVGPVKGSPGQCSGETPRIGRDASLPIAVVITRDEVGRREHFLDRRVEPAIDAVPDQLATDKQHEHRRDQRHPEEDRDELSAESRERQGPPPFNDQLDHVTREHEGEAEQDREVCGPQAVQDSFGQEIGSQPGRAVCKRDDADERGQQDDHAHEDEPRVVAQRAARRCHRQLILSRSAGP